jgi:hypothetical protein
MRGLGRNGDGKIDEDECEGEGQTARVETALGHGLAQATEDILMGFGRLFSFIRLATAKHAAQAHDLVGHHPAAVQVM